MPAFEPYNPPYLWPAGEGGLVAPDRVLVAGRWDSAPIRRAARKARAENRLIDLTFGYACKWVLFLDNGYLVLTTEPIPVASAREAAWSDERFINQLDRGGAS